MDVSDKRVKNFNSGVDLAEGIASLAEPPTSENRLRFYRKLKNAELLIPIDRLTGRPPAMSARVRKNAGMAEIKCLPAFTDAETLRAAPAPFKAVKRVPYDALRYLIIEEPENFSAMAVNIFSAPLILEAGHMDMKDRLVNAVTVRQNDSRNVRKADPSEYPEGLVKAINREMRHFPKVLRVYILEARSERMPDPYWLFAVDFHGDKKRFAPEFMKIVRPFMPEGSAIEISKIDRDKRWMIKGLGAAPVYDREEADIGR